MSHAPARARRCPPVRVVSCLILTLLLAACGDATVSLQPPPGRPSASGFTLQTVVTGLNMPTAIDFAPDGTLFIAELPGVVRVYADGRLLAEPFIDLRDEVNLSENRGLIGLAVHPDFPRQPWLYLQYAYDPPETAGRSGRAGPDGDGQRVGRLVRVRADAAAGYRRAVPGSEQVLVGRNSTWAHIARPANAQEDASGGWTCYRDFRPFGTPVRDCIPSDGRSHSVGGLAFGPDGALYAAIGDGASYVIRDDRAMRAQDLDSLAGKILRLDPDTGLGLPDNPWFDGDPASNRSRVVAYGLRNPFRFSVDPQDGTLWIGDVGWASWEEIDRGRGHNFGWPCYEGGDGRSLPTEAYRDQPYCRELYARGTPVTAAVYAWDRRGYGGAALAGPVYRAAAYPAEWRGTLFFGDYAQGWLRGLRLGPDGRRVVDFADGLRGPVDLKVGPDGLLYVVEVLRGRVRRFAYGTAAGGGAGAVPGNHPPRLPRPPNRVDAVGDSVRLTLAADDPDGDPLFFTAHGLPLSVQLRPRKGEIGGVLTEAGDHAVLLSVDDGRGGRAEAAFRWRVVRPDERWPGLRIEALRGHGLCLRAESQANGGGLLQGGCTDTTWWRPQYTGAGYQLRAADTTLCLTVTDDRAEPGAPAVLRPCTGRPSQYWRLQADGAGKRLVGMASGLCLGVAGDAPTPGAPVQLQECDERLGQRWLFTID